MDQAEIHEGGCACGTLRFRTYGEPAKTALCHCRYCQTRTGSAFGVSVYFHSENFELLSGEPQVYRFETESGREFVTRFCGRCGASVFWTLGLFDGMTGVAGGAYDPPTFWYEVKREVFTRTRAPFVCTSIADASETSSGYKPVHPDAPHLTPKT